MDDYRFLEMAFSEAVRGRAAGQIPIGCVIVNGSGDVVASDHNRIDELGDPTAHAEMLAIRSAISRKDGGRMQDWTLYSALEPCPMCMGTIIMCHVGRVVWAAPDRRIAARELLSASAYMRSRTLNVAACPYPDLEQKCSEIHDVYWISNGRPDAVHPI